MSRRYNWGGLDPKSHAFGADPDATPRDGSAARALIGGTSDFSGADPFSNGCSLMSANMEPSACCILNDCAWQHRLTNVWLSRVEQSCTMRGTTPQPGCPAAARSVSAAAAAAAALPAADPATAGRRAAAAMSAARPAAWRLVRRTLEAGSSRMMQRRSAGHVTSAVPAGGTLTTNCNQKILLDRHHVVRSLPAAQPADNRGFCCMSTLALHSVLHRNLPADHVFGVPSHGREPQEDAGMLIHSQARSAHIHPTHGHRKADLHFLILRSPQLELVAWLVTANY